MNSQGEVQLYREGIPHYTRGFLKLESCGCSGCIRMKTLVGSQRPGPCRCGDGRCCWLGDIRSRHSWRTAPRTGGAQKQDRDTAVKRFHPDESAKMEEQQPSPESSGKGCWLSSDQSVSRVLSDGVIHRDSHFSRSTIARTLQQPTRGVLIEMGALAASWPCSSWGLPCRSCRHERGGLLLHLFTLAPFGAVCFLWHFPS